MGPRPDLGITPEVFWPDPGVMLVGSWRLHALTPASCQEGVSARPWGHADVILGSSWALPWYHAGWVSAWLWGHASGVSDGS